MLNGMGVGVAYATGVFVAMGMARILLWVVLGKSVPAMAPALIQLQVGLWAAWWLSGQLVPTFGQRVRSRVAMGIVAAGLLFAAELWVGTALLQGNLIWGLADWHRPEAQLVIGASLLFGLIPMLRW